MLMGDFLEQFDLLYQAIFAILPRSFRPFVTPTLTVVTVMLVALLIRQVVIKGLKRYSARTANPYDDVVVALIDRRILLWAFLIALLMALPEMPWRQGMIRTGITLVTATFVLSLAMATGRALGAIAPLYAVTTGTGLSGTTLIKYVAQFLIYALGASIILSMFDISVAPAITALGIGGLAVALAFQDTLSNVFAGIAMTLSQHIRINDYVQLDSGEEGFIYDIGWRYTVIRSFQNNLVIIPNRKMADSVVTNFHLPDPQLRIELTVTVGFECDLVAVERVLLEVARQAVGQVQGVLAEPAATVRFKEFNVSGVLTKLFVSIDDFNQKYVASHELMKRVHIRFREEGIMIPYPVRTIRFSQSSGNRGGEHPYPDAE